MEAEERRLKAVEAKEAKRLEAEMESKRLETEREKLRLLEA